VTALPRGSIPRGAAILILKRASRAWRATLMSGLTEIKPLDRPDLGFVAVDSMVNDALYWFGVQGYEGQVANVWIDACRQARSVLEIGGNIGLFTVIGGKVAPGAYTVVEPVPGVASVLRRNLARNGLAGIEVLEAAAIPGDTGRTVTLTIPAEGRSAPVGAFLSDHSEVTDRRAETTITVQGVPFRELITGRDLVKVDAEGIEYQLLASVRDVLLSERPTLLIEVLPESRMLGEFLAAIARDAGYRIVIVPEWGSAKPIAVDPDTFTASLPARFNSKDVLLTCDPALATGA